MKNILLEPQIKAEKIDYLTEFISKNPDAREIKRALAIKMALADEPYTNITKLLGIHKSCITYWKHRFEAQGIDGIKLGYQGAKSYLTSQQRGEVTAWLKTRNSWDFDELVAYIDEHYGVVYASRQSYYTLLSEAGISWKKSQKINPKFDPELVKEKREEIQEFIGKNQADIESGRLVLFFR